MKACYFDASVILRYLLGQPGRLDLSSWSAGMLTSELALVESRRVLDRLRWSGRVGLTDLQHRRDELDQVTRVMWIEPMHRAVLQRASDPMDLPLGTLDAIHLATALLWRDEHGEEVDFATHDLTLAQAARLYGCRVLGAEAAG